MLNCKYCNITSTSIGNFRKHILTQKHKLILQHNLESDTTNTISITTGNTHTEGTINNNVSVKENYTCKYCAKTFTSINHLKVHFTTKKHINNMAKYTISEIHNNVNTNTTYISIKSNAVSRENISNNLESKYKCLYCKKALSSLFSLNRHYHICKHANYSLNLQKTDIINNLLKTQKQQIKQNTTQNTAQNNINIVNTDITKHLALPAKGIIYLIQPVELIGTNRYKIGFSSKCTLERCVTGYKKGSRYINIQECFEPSKLESKLKAEFKNKFRLIGGTEYFWGDERQMRKTFNELFELHDSVYEIFYTIPHVETIEANNSLLLSSEDTINPINITDISI
jgi:hypothetical protein